ncbi:MAG: cell envelope integrity protein TolA [Desulfobacterales bacterium]|jgi:colicin import membrane protein
MGATQHIRDDIIPDDAGKRSRTFFLFVIVSFICHGIVFGSLVLLPKLAPAEKRLPPTINVSLVSLPANTGPDISSSGETYQAPKKRAAPKAAPQSKPTVSVAPKKRKPKVSLKKKTFKSRKVIEQAITRLEKEVEDSRPPSLNEALDKLKHQVEKTDPAERLRKEAVESLARKGSGVGEGSLTDHQKISGVMQIYNAEIKYHIQKNWVFSEQFAGSNQDLETALAIKVLPSGEITDIWFDKKSGNTHMDDSAYKALIKSNPLPPLPEEFTRPDYTIGFRFGPKGLK